MPITTHETAQKSPKEVPVPRRIDSDKDSTNNGQDNEENQEVLIPIDEDTGKNLMIFATPTGCLICIWTMGVASKWVKPRLQNFLSFLSIIIANFSENLVTIASIFPLSMALLD